jgi:hypothetical protein
VSESQKYLDRRDERVKHSEGAGDAIRAFIDRMRAGDLGSLPVVVGLVIICTVFTALNPVFVSPNNLVNLLFDCSTVGIISLGIVCMLMVGEIDLSVGSVSGFASALLGVLWVNEGWPVALAILAAVVAGALRGDAGGPARGPRPAALHPGTDRLDQPALWLVDGEFRAIAGDAEAAVLCTRRDTRHPASAAGPARRIAAPAGGALRAIAG